MKILKVSLISLLFVLAPAIARPCAPANVERWYMFSVCQDGFREKFDKDNALFWEKYCGAKSGAWISDADRIKAAKDKGDNEMVKYLTQLEKYQQLCGDIFNSWQYPTATQLMQYEREMGTVAQTAQQNMQSGKLAQRWALLYMRANMVLKNYNANIYFWDDYASKYPNNDLKEMMRNIYANALLNTGKKREAWNIYAEQNDQQSLLWSVRKFTNLAGIKQIYSQDPDSPVLAFLLQHYINTLQDCVDAAADDCEVDLSSDEAYAPISKDYRREMQDFCQFAAKVAQEKKTNNPAMWMSAAALVNMFLDNNSLAATQIDEAMKMKGTDETHKMARRIRMLIACETRDINSTEFKTFMADELKWLDSDIRKNGGTYAINARDRILNLGLAKKYRNSHPFLAIGLQTLRGIYSMQAQRNKYAKFYTPQELDEYYSIDIAADHSSDAFRMLNDLSADNVERYFQFASSPSDDPLASYIFNVVDYPQQYIADVTGTRYLAEGNFDKALTLLEKVPMDYLAAQGIAPYAASRDYHIPAWFRFQKSNPNARLTRNVKADFCREMSDLQQHYNRASASERARLAYDMAVNLYQASSNGQCWYLTDYSWTAAPYDYDNNVSIAWPYDTLGRKAVALLEEAAKSDDNDTRALAYFALAGTAPDSWASKQWDYAKNAYSNTAIPSSQQYRAYSNFDNFVKSHNVSMPQEVTRCDILKQFRKLKR